MDEYDIMVYYISRVVADSKILVKKGDSGLRTGLHLLFTQFLNQRVLVDFLQEPRAQSIAHRKRAPDDFTAQRVDLFTYL